MKLYAADHIKPLSKRISELVKSFRVSTTSLCLITHLVFNSLNANAHSSSCETLLAMPTPPSGSAYAALNSLYLWYANHQNSEAILFNKLIRAESIPIGNRSYHRQAWNSISYNDFSFFTHDNFFVSIQMHNTATYGGPYVAPGNFLIHKQDLFPAAEIPDGWDAIAHVNKLGHHYDPELPMESWTDVAIYLPGFELHLGNKTYIVQSLLGRGSEGKVYVVKDLNDRPWILKTFFSAKVCADNMARLKELADLKSDLYHSVVDYERTALDKLVLAPFFRGLPLSLIVQKYQDLNCVFKVTKMDAQFFSLNPQRVLNIDTGEVVVIDPY